MTEFLFAKTYGHPHVGSEWSSFGWFPNRQFRKLMPFSIITLPTFVSEELWEFFDKPRQTTYRPLSNLSDLSGNYLAWLCTPVCGLTFLGVIVWGQLSGIIGYTEVSYVACVPGVILWG